MPVSIAVVGSGPAGFYAIEALLQSGLDVEIDILERLPTPFGLIRAGVAPDHQSTKSVARKFERWAEDTRVRYFGNVEIGRDVGIPELREMYDAVVLAVGAPKDKPLGIPGADKKGVYGSAAFVGWYNGHPDFRDLNPDLNTPSVAVVGNGNVAIDVARILVRTPKGMATSDLPDHAAATIHAAPIRDVHLIGRRGPLQAKFTNTELRELEALTDCVTVIDPAEIPADADGLDDKERRVAEKNLKTFRTLGAIDPGRKRKRLYFRFFAAPAEILGGDKVEALRVERTRIADGKFFRTGQTFDIPCGLIVSAIGYRAMPLDGVPIDPRSGTVSNRDGRIDSGFYAVGWLKRGPVGVIGSSKPDADAVVEFIRTDCPVSRKPGRRAFREILRMRGVRPISFADWKRIEAAEIENAAAPAPRRKFVTVPDMMAVLDRH